MSGVMLLQLLRLGMGSRRNSAEWLPNNRW